MGLQARFVTFFVSPFSESSATAELNDFLKSHRVVNVEKTFIDGQRGTGWAFLVEYTDSPDPAAPASRVDYRDILNEEDFAVYDLLRKKRKEISQSRSLPLYGIFSNEQLAQMAQERPQTAEDLKKIRQVSPQKAAEFAKDFLDILCSHPKEEGKAASS